MNTIEALTAVRYPSDMDLLRLYAYSNSREYDDAAYLAAPGGSDEQSLRHPINFVPEEVGEAILVSKEARRLYLEHMETDIHTGDNYVVGCPTCESWGEVYFEHRHD